MKNMLITSVIVACVSATISISSSLAAEIKNPAAPKFLPCTSGGMKSGECGFALGCALSKKLGGFDCAQPLRPDTPEPPKPEPAPEPFPVPLPNPLPDPVPGIPAQGGGGASEKPGENRMSPILFEGSIGSDETRKKPE